MGNLILQNVLNLKYAGLFRFLLYSKLDVQTSSNYICFGGVCIEDFSYNKCTWHMKTFETLKAWGTLLKI